MGSSVLPVFSPATSAAEQTHTKSPPPLNAPGFQLHPPGHTRGCPLRGAQLPGFQSWLQPLSGAVAFPKLCNFSASVFASVQWECQQQLPLRTLRRVSEASTCEALDTQTVLGHCEQLLLSQPSESLETVPPQEAHWKIPPLTTTFPLSLPGGRLFSSGIPQDSRSQIPRPRCFH